MKFKGITTKNGKTFIRKRESIFDAKLIQQSSFGEFKDHKEMKTWEYAAFQKEQFAQIKKRRRQFYFMVLIATVIAFLLVFLIPYIIDWFNKFGTTSFDANH